MFKRCFAALALCATLVTAATARDVWVDGYVRSDGTYVFGHFRSVPDGNFWNNWSTWPNVNPYTRRVGARRTPNYPTYRPFGVQPIRPLAPLRPLGYGYYYQPYNYGW